MPKKSQSAMLRYLKIHGPALLFLQVLIFVVFWRLMHGGFWHALDFQILMEADTMARNPLVMFGHIGTYFSQPLLQLAFLAEYVIFGLNFAPYIAVNLAIHGLNSFMVYMLINMLFYRPRMALLAASLFAVGVGHYGRTLQTVNDLEGLLLGFMHLAVLYLFIRNDFRRSGRVRSTYFIVGLAVYVAAGLTKASTLSIMGCLLAYKIFFYAQRRGRPILSADLVVFLFVGLVFQIGQARFGYRGPTVVIGDPGPVQYTLLSIANLFRYLNLMLLPMQESNLLKAAGSAVHAIYEIRMVIYPLVTLSIVAYSFFGFVFGGSALRFFIAWTYITLIPFSGTPISGTWLNLNHLYLASLGFCVTLSAGALGTSTLLQARRWRRLLPFLLPLTYAAVSLLLAYRLDARNDVIAGSSRVRGYSEALEEVIQRPVGDLPLDHSP